MAHKTLGYFSRGLKKGQRVPYESLRLASGPSSSDTYLSGGELSDPSLRATGTPGYVYRASLPSLLHGYDTGVIAGALLYLVPALGLKDAPLKVGIIVTACTVGAVFGSCVSPVALRKAGRVGSLKFASLIFLLSAIFSGASPGFLALSAARFLAGIAMGVSSAAVPLYVAETAEKHQRGKAATVPQVSKLCLFCLFLSFLAAAAWSHFTLHFPAASFVSSAAPLSFFTFLFSFLFLRR